MNDKAIEQAKNPDIRGSLQALQRAAQRARELAAKTGTELIVTRGGVIERIKPLPNTAGQNASESGSPYADTLR